MAGSRRLPAKPAEVTRNASVLPKPASAPSELVMPGTASAASSAAAARATSCSVVGSVGSTRSSASRLRRRGGVGEARVGILGHHPRHRHGALGQFLEAGGIHGAGRDHGRPLPQEHPQPEVAAFRALDVLGLAQPALHRQRRAGDQHRIRRIRAGRAGAGDQVGEEVKGFGPWLSSTGALRAVLFRPAPQATSKAQASDPRCKGGQAR